MADVVYDLKKVGADTWTLRYSPMSLTSEDELTVDDLPNPVPGRVKYQMPDGSVRNVNVVFSRLEGASSCPYLRAQDLDSIAGAP